MKKRDLEKFLPPFTFLIGALLLGLLYFSTSLNSENIITIARNKFIDIFFISAYILPLYFIIFSIALFLKKHKNIVIEITMLSSIPVITISIFLQLIIKGQAPLIKEKILLIFKENGDVMYNLLTFFVLLVSVLEIFFLIKFGLAGIDSKDKPIKEPIKNIVPKLKSFQTNIVDINPDVKIQFDKKNEIENHSIKDETEEFKIFKKTPTYDPAIEEIERSFKEEQNSVAPIKREGIYKKPTTSILKMHDESQYWIIDEHTKKLGEILIDTLEEFSIQAKIIGIQKGPVITMFEILPAPGIKISKIQNLSNNIALRLAATRVRIVAPIPGKHAVGVEIPNRQRALVSFKEIIDSKKFKNSTMEIPAILGKNITGEPQIIDITTTPHLLIAGSTGSGKSVCVNSIITSILYKKNPKEVKLILIDPKQVELTIYNDIPHLLTQVITEPKKAYMALQYCLAEMDRRYNLLSQVNAKSLKTYNEKIISKGLATLPIPYIVLVIDEFADLMLQSKKDMEVPIARLAAMARAVGIHIILATQRPSVDIITGIIKANFPSRIAFMTTNSIDSRTILDEGGAEKLLGQGDMLHISGTNPFPTRIQGAFLSEAEVEDVVKHVKSYGEPEYIDDEIFIDENMFNDEYSDSSDDPLLESAIDIIRTTKKASASFLQRKLSIGYNRAARIIELLEEKGYIGPQNGSKPREVFIDR